MKIIQTPSPNFNDRQAGVDLLLLHYTGMKSGKESLDRLCDPAAQVSAHYMIEEDGRIFQLVAEEKRAWHAGRSFWAGESDINSRSIGIEIVNPGHEFGYRAFPPEQIEAVIALSKQILQRWAIRAARVLAHSDVAPLRKEDPGELFPWRQLADRGVGFWPSAKARKASAAEVKGWLASFGYGYLDEGFAAVLRAVQRRFRPSHIDGLLDPETAGIAAWLGGV